MGEVLGSRIVLRSGDEVFTVLKPDELPLDGLVPFLVLALVPMEELSLEEPLRYARVRRSAIDLVEPLDEREVEAHRRDREEWIEHG